MKDKADYDERNYFPNGNLLNLMFQMDYLLVLRIRTRTNVEAVT